MLDCSGNSLLQQYFTLGLELLEADCTRVLLVVEYFQCGVSTFTAVKDLSSSSTSACVAAPTYRPHCYSNEELSAVFFLCSPPLPPPLLWSAALNLAQRL